MRNKQLTVFYLVVLLILTFTSLLTAASGRIEGYVLDSQTTDALPGANIFLEGTNFGAATDLNGKYFIPAVPAGSYKIKVSYIGYQEMTLDVVVEDNKTTKVNVPLDVQALEGETIVVTAQAAGQMQAINQQLTSDKIVNVVSESRIQELPDFNAAQAIGRLPGVSTLESSGEANKVVIRGLAPQYNTVSVEGVQLASTGSSQIGVSALGNTSGSISNDRSVDLTMVSPYMIRTVALYKALTPDMHANSIGGTVNMELREAPSELKYDILWQAGYTAKTSYYGNYRGVASVSQRFLDDRLGVYLLGNIERYDRDDDNMSASYRTNSSIVDTTTGFRPVSVTNVTQNRHIETRQRYGGNLILDYQLPSGSIKMVNMYTRLSSDYQDNRTILNYFDKILNFSYREGENNTDLIVNNLDFKYDFNFLQMDVKLANTYSKNNLPESPFFEFKTGPVTTGPVTPNTIPDSLKKLWAYPGDTLTYLDNLNLFSSLYKENKTIFAPNFKFPFSLGSLVTGYLKLGGEYYLQENTNDQATPYASIRSSGTFQTAMVNDLSNVFGIAVDPSTAKFAASNFTGDPEIWQNPFLDNQFGQLYWSCDPTILRDMTYYLNNSPQWRGRATGGADQTGGWYNGIFQTLANSYKYVERYSAGYLMSELKYQDIMVVGGARYERTASEYTAYNMFDMRNPDAQDCDTVIVTPQNEFWLPMVQGKYSPLEWFDVRYAYTQTLARPDYHQMSPKITYDSPRMNVRAGNPDLVPAHAFNHDLNITFHTSELGLLTIGGFYKTIEDFTYFTTYKLHQTSTSDYIKTVNDFDIMGIKPADGATVYTYINSPYPAYVKGLELDYQTRLWYLPYGLSGVVLGINYTKIESDATYPMRDEVTDYSTRPPVTTTRDSTRSGRLIYQPNDILNAYIGYDYEGFSARLSFLFQGNSVSYIGAFPEQDGYTKDYFRIDASVRQRLPIWGMEIYLDVSNLNQEKNQSAQISIDGFTNVKSYGLTANMGIRFRN